MTCIYTIPCHTTGTDPFGPPIFIIFCYLLVWCQARSVNFEFYDSCEYIWEKQCFPLKQQSLLVNCGITARIWLLLAFAFLKTKLIKTKHFQDLSYTVCSLKAGPQGCSRKNYPVKLRQSLPKKLSLR